MGRGAARAALYLALAVAVLLFASAECLRRRGADPAPAAVFYAGPSWLLAPYNLWVGARSLGGDAPFPSKALHFPAHGVLEANWEAIRGEALALYAGGRAGRIRGDAFFRRIADDGWRRFYLKWYGPTDPEARRLCPRTTALLDALPEVRLAMFSFLEPGAAIRPHVGPSKGAKRYHLGLSCPPEARIVVDGREYHWRDGEGVLFDDTFLHSVENRSPDRVRAILFCDVDTRFRSPGAAAVNRWVLDRLAPLTTRSNDRVEARSKASAPAQRGEAAGAQK